MTKSGSELKKNKKEMSLSEETQGLSNLDEKIEKLKKLIEENHGSTSYKQIEKTEKLQQKLRYLEFFKSYPLSSCNQSFKCSECHETKASVVDEANSWCKNCKKSGGGQKDCLDGLPCDAMEWRYKKGVKIVCGDPDQHEREWQIQEKSRAEVRNQIKREYAAMIKKEKEMGIKSNKGKIITVDDAVQVYKKPCKVTVKEVLKHEIDVIDEVKQDKNFHGDDCKTCIRMKSVMGSILPHPINVK